MKIRAVIFDFYGVLGLNGWQEFKHRHFHGHWDAWEKLRVLGQKVDAGEATDEEFVTALCQATGQPESAVRYSFEHTQANTELLDFIRLELADYKVGLLSNASRDVLPKLFTDKQRALFDEVVMSAHEGMTKPDDRMFALVAERLGVKPGECLLVDDQSRHLVSAAKLGMQTVHFTDNTAAIQTILELLKND